MKNDTLIILDGGHGQQVVGKCSPDGKLKEYIYAREIVQLIYNGLKDLGYNPYIVVPELDDIPLNDRVRRVNKLCRENNRKAICISIHCNAAGADGKWHSARGFMPFIAQNASNNSKRLAKTLYEECEKRNLKGNRSVPSEKYWVQSLAMCRDTICPAVLTENLFQDNKEDVEFLLSDKGKQTIADLHIQGIIRYLNE